MPPESQVHRQVVRKRAEEHPIDIDPVVRLALRRGRASRTCTIRRATSAACSRRSPSNGASRAPQAPISPTLAGLQKTLRAGGWTVTVALRKGRDIVAILPGFAERAFGVAIDIGSTTIAAHLCDLASGEVVASVGAMNPQIRFGEDLMSRVSYVMMNPGGDAELTRAVREAMDALIGEAATRGRRRARRDPRSDAGRQSDHASPRPRPRPDRARRRALRADDRRRPTRRARADLGLDIAPGAFVYALPCIAGHVGADTAGVVLAEAPYRARRAARCWSTSAPTPRSCSAIATRLLACSSPTGPAFEGAQISCGQRAAPGAIERVRIDRATLEPRFKVIGCDLWSDEPGFAEATASLGVTGVCGSGIIEAIAEMYLAGIISQDGVIDGALAARTPRIEAVGRTFAYVLNDGAPRLVIYQTDVRAIQLAKAALYAGAKLLIERRGGEPPERITLAGAFGAISIRSTRWCSASSPIAISRRWRAPATRRAPARASRCSTSPRARRSRASCARIEKIETAIEPNFQDRCSSPRWRSPTRPTRSRISRSGSTCRRRRRRRRRRSPAPARRARRHA